MYACTVALRKLLERWTRAGRTLVILMNLALLGMMLGIATACDNVRTVAPNPEARPTDATRATTPSRPAVPEQPSAAPSSLAAPVASAPAAASAAASAAEAPAPPRRIYIHPLGPLLPDADAEFVSTSLAAFYAMDVLMLPRSPLPSDAYYKPRSRYRAEKLLTHLQASLPEDGFRVLGLTGHDISTTKDQYEDWGILGLATVDGEACVISTFRTKKGATSPEHSRIRLGKTAVHEIGHTLGLPHCPNAGCLMEDARGTVSTTDTEYDLCPDCRAKLGAAGYPLATGKPIPWPRPGGYE